MNFFRALVLASSLGLSTATPPTIPNDGQGDIADGLSFEEFAAATYSQYSATATAYGPEKSYGGRSNGTYYVRNTTTTSCAPQVGEIVATMQTNSELLVPTRTNDQLQTYVTCMTVTAGFPTYFSPQVQKTQESLKVPPPPKQTPQGTASLRKPQTQRTKESLNIPTSTPQTAYTWDNLSTPPAQLPSPIVQTMRTETELLVPTLEPAPTPHTQYTRESLAIPKPLPTKNLRQNSGGGGVVIVTKAPTAVTKTHEAVPTAGDEEDDKSPITVIVQPHHQIPESVLASVLNSLAQQYGGKEITTKTRYVIGGSTILPGSTGIVYQGTTYSAPPQFGPAAGGNAQGIIYVNGQSTPATAVPALYIHTEESTATVTESATGQTGTASSESSSSASTTEAESQTADTPPLNTSETALEQNTSAAVKMSVSTGCIAILMAAVAMI